LADVRRQVLCAVRDPEAVYAEVSTMRERWRQERDRSDALRLDLKQGHGALLDIEFALQGLVLAHAARQPGLLDATASTTLIDACRDVGLLTVEQADILHVAHSDLLQLALACTLDLRPRVATRDAALEATCAAVSGVIASLGFRM
jgi:[glutamine synthetase] adenylyltransferase / [glutamine synthetase]-adenylyl-L-tyrosine phosphorylase